MIDMSGKMMMRQICTMLALPWNDVDVALAMVRPVQIGNARWYNIADATRALESFYVHRIEENRERHAKTGAKMYVVRANNCADRLNRVRRYMDEMEGEHYADHQAGNR